MSDVNFVEAWLRWGQGIPMEGARLWGLSFLWWARIGKLLQFAGALTVVLDLIGPERLRSAGRFLRGWPLRKLVATPVVLLVIGLVVLTAGDMASSWILFRFQPDWVAPVLWGLVALIALGYGLLQWARTRSHAWLERAAKAVLWGAGGVSVLAIAALALGYYIPIALLAAAVFLCLWLAGFLLDVGILMPTIWVLDRELPGHPLKWAAFVMLIVGFHFDLLAS